MKTTSEEKKNRILEALGSARQAILDAAAEFPPEKQDQVFLGIWSIKDLIAHLVGWDYANLQAIGELCAGKLPGFYTHIGKDWAGYNALLVSQYKCEDFPSLLAAVRESHRGLVEAAREVPAEDFDRDWQVRYKGYRVLISRQLQAEANDERIHLTQIRSFIEARPEDSPDE